MDMVKLSVAVRDPKVSPKTLRRSGSVPCVVYGNGAQTTLQCEERALHKAFVQAGESTLVELAFDGSTLPVLFKEVSFDPVSGREIHADFYAVNMKEEIETQVPLHFEGESPAVKDLQAILVTPHTHVTVRCLPGDLPHALAVSIAGLAAYHDVVTVSQITLPKGVTVTEPADTVIATVQEQRKEEVIAPPTPTPEEAAAAAAAEGAVATAEGAAPAEGEAAPAEAAAKEKK